MVRIAIFNLKYLLRLVLKLIIILIIMIFIFSFLKLNKLYMDINIFEKLLLSNIFVDRNIDNDEIHLSLLKNKLNREYNINEELIIVKNENVEKEEEKNNQLTIDNIDEKIYNITYRVDGNNIKNNTQYDINYNELVNKDININKNTTILIIHTHGSESYSNIEHTDYFRNEDINKNVVNIGTNLANILKSSGYNVIHDTTLYDYPTYSGSYTRSLESIEKYKKDNPNIDIVIDIHRDAVSNSQSFGPTCEIDGNIASKLLLIVGTDGGGMEHKNWSENLSFALKLYSAGEQMYPGIFRQLNITNSRYNQHATNGSILLEVGATGNTMEQSINSVKYFARILDEVLKEE